MKIINNSSSIVGLPGVGEVGPGESVDASAAQIAVLEGLPIVAKWIKTGAIAFDRGEAESLDEPRVALYENVELSSWIADEND